MNLKISLFRKLLIVSMLVTGIFLTSCNSGQEKTSDATGELSGTITLSGAFALYPMVVKWSEEFKKLHPKVRIDVSAGGAGKGMTDALTGIADLGMFSRGITDVEKGKGVWWVSVVKDAVLPTINAKSAAWETISKTGIKQATFNEIFITKKINDWSQIDSKSKGQINVFTRSDACGAAEMWASFFKKHQEDLQGTGVFGDPGMADAVKKDVNGMGYNNVVYVYDTKTRKTYDGINVIPLDLNGNGTLDANENFYQNLDSVMSAIKSGRYPSPPARELYLVAKGKPQKREVIEFIRYILNQGQKIVMEAGYVELPQQNIELELKKLN